MNSTGVVLVLLLISWGTSALPCDTCWTGTETEVVGDVLPAEEVIIVPSSSEEEVVADPEPVILDSSSSDFDAAEVIVEPPSDGEIFRVGLCDSNPEACAIAPTADDSDDDDDSSEEVEVTTEKA